MIQVRKTTERTMNLTKSPMLPRGVSRLSLVPWGLETAVALGHKGECFWILLAEDLSLLTTVTPGRHATEGVSLDASVLSSLPAIGQTTKGVEMEKFPDLLVLRQLWSDHREMMYILLPPLVCRA